MSSLEKTNPHQIWFLSHSYLPALGGIENYIREAGRQFLKRGYRVTVICRRFDPGLPEEEAIDGIRVIRHPDFTVPRNKLFTKPLYLSRQFAGWLEERDIIREGWILCRHAPYGYALSLIKKTRPFIYLPAGVLPVQSHLSTRPGDIKSRIFTRIWRKQLSFLEQSAIQRASSVMVLSHNMSRQLGEYYGIDPETIQINPAGVSLERFTTQPSNPELARELGLRAEVRTLLFLGRFSPEKNILFLLQSLRPLLEENQAVLLLVGGGPSRKKLEQSVQKMKIGNAVRITGPVVEPEKYYPLADIFISPAVYEPFGQNLLEAMASGLPVIALRDAPPAVRVAAGEIIVNGETGFIIDERPDSLREKIELLLDSNDLRREMGRKARKLCGERFSWDRHVDELLNVMNNLPHQARP